MGKIKLIAFDVDGTLTPGTLIFGPDGEAYKSFYAKDGLAISLAHRMGFITGLVTGRNSPIVERRSAELHMDFALMGVRDKVAALSDILMRYGLTWEEAAYFGDDWNDLAVSRKAGLAGCPSDGTVENKEAVSFVASAPGGRGAAREFIEHIFKKEGCFESALHSYDAGAVPSGQ